MDRKCNGCGRVLPYTNEFFNYKNKSKGELQSRCKSCTRKSTKDSRKRNGRETLNIDISSKEKKIIESNAKKVGLDVSKYLREVAIKNQPIIIKDLIEVEEIEHTIGNVDYQIKKLGVNVNQIAKRLNENKQVSDETIVALIEVLDRLNIRMKRIEDAIAKSYESLY